MMRVRVIANPSVFVRVVSTEAVDMSLTLAVRPMAIYRGDQMYMEVRVAKAHMYMLRYPGWNQTVIRQLRAVCLHVEQYC